MAAAVQDNVRLLKCNDAEMEVAIRVSVMTSDQLETISYNFPRAPGPVVPRDARFRVITAPTARCIIAMECDPSAATAASMTVPARFYTEVGGDIAGAVVEIILSFDAFHS